MINYKYFLHNDVNYWRSLIKINLYLKKLCTSYKASHDVIDLISYLISFCILFFYENEF